MILDIFLIVLGLLIFALVIFILTLHFVAHVFIGNKQEFLKALRRD